jgi:hypothetical protein
MIVRAALTERGWPEPIVIDSGNGCHLLYKGDRCAPGGEILKLALKFLSSTFSTDAAKVDVTVFNPARISRLPFTINKKAARTASVLEYPKTFDAVPAWKIHNLATEGGLKQDYDIAKPTLDRTLLLDEEGVRRLIAEFPRQLHLDRVTHCDGITYFGLSECPFVGRAHSDQNTGAGKTAIMLGADWIGFKCFSDNHGGQEATFGNLLHLLHRATGRRPSMPIWETDDAALAERWGGIEDVSQRSKMEDFRLPPRQRWVIAIERKLTDAQIEYGLDMFAAEHMPRWEARQRATEEWQQDAAWKAREFSLEDFAALLWAKQCSDGVWMS